MNEIKSINYIVGSNCPVHAEGENIQVRPNNTSNSLIKNIIQNWTRMNGDKSLSSGQRTKEKISSIHDFVQQKAKALKLDSEEVEWIVDENKQKYKDPSALLASYRLQHFPELAQELLLLENSKEISSLFRMNIDTE